MLTVNQVITKDYCALSFKASIEEAATYFLKQRLRRVPVVDDAGKPVGMVDTNSFLIAMVSGVDLSSPVYEVMSENFLSIEENAPLKKLMTYPIDTILVVDEKGLLTGLVKKSDMSRIINKKCWSYNNQFKNLLNTLPIGLLVTNAEGLVVLCTAFAEKVLGISANEVTNKYLPEVLEDHVTLSRVLTTGEAQKRDKEVINGVTVIRSWYPIIHNNSISGAVEIIQDVSEQEVMSEELTDARELCQELEAIIDNSYDGIVVTDTKGKLLRISNSFARISGIPRGKLEEYLGKYMCDLVASGKISNTVTEKVLVEKKATTINLRIKDGPELTVTGSPVFNDQNEVFRVVCNIRDISQLNELKRQIKENKDLAARYYSELEELRARQLQLDGFIVHSPEMRRAVELAFRVAAVDSTVLITGETGVGKEVIAKIIHQASPRKEGPFITVNCGAIPEALLESELFGYEKGAFTGANRDGKPGLLEVANNGTLFLDEIGDLPLMLQVKLLRAIQEQEITRVGGVKPLKLDIRILAATNKRLEEMVKEKTFREDLFYRLNVIPVNIPPLRNRREDIIPLAAYFLDCYGNNYGMKKKFSHDALAIMENYSWPGNTRELQNVVERSLIMSEGDIILPRNLPPYLEGPKKDSMSSISVHDILPLKEAGEILERELLSKALNKGKSTRKAASLLGIDHSTVVRKINKYQISVK